MDLAQLSFRLSAVIHRTVLLLLLLLRLTCSPVRGELQVVGPPQAIVAAVGDDVILPCHVEPQVSVARLTVEWSRLDVRPDPNDRLSRISYVHLYRHAAVDRDMQLAAYAGRTALFKDGLRQGNISLKISNLTLSDTGRYRCFIPKLAHSKKKSSVVSLVVEPNSHQTQTTEMPLGGLQTPRPTEDTDANGVLSSARSREFLIVMSCILVMIPLAGVAVYLKLKKQEDIRLPTV